ncbi:hypothetical protein T440DRAFT_141664 [Plenodomus tracheiphilus IPT5]|uniref:Uncharacterized protein n=1 Tax=Plenodomus tracheiphilus IPT5 TaxID=1408161 RepID=A0A6A7B3C0_9PLEO|nr:hypothetical protein T440DRAFT_141664 [Plenodomus tracheiphilus IPT5]
MLHFIIALKVLCISISTETVLLTCKGCARAHVCGWVPELGFVRVWVPVFGDTRLLIEIWGIVWDGMVLSWNDVHCVMKPCSQFWDINRGIGLCEPLSAMGLLWWYVGEYLVYDGIFDLFRDRRTIHEACSCFVSGN